MNINTYGYWNQKKAKLKHKFPIITDRDLTYCEGKENVMIEMLGFKLGKTKLELLRIMVNYRSGSNVPEGDNLLKYFFEVNDFMEDSGDVRIM
jgi:hypothetical protein